MSSLLTHMLLPDTAAAALFLACVSCLHVCHNRSDARRGTAPPWPAQTPQRSSCGLHHGHGPLTRPTAPRLFVTRLCRPEHASVDDQHGLLPSEGIPSPTGQPLLPLPQRPAADPGAPFTADPDAPFAAMGGACPRKLLVTRGDGGQMGKGPVRHKRKWSHCANTKCD